MNQMCRILVAFVFVTTTSVHAVTPGDALTRAQAWLWNRQRDDGSWRSEQYAVMRSGQALTPFVLHTLLDSIDELKSDDAGRSRRAINFIGANVDDEGALGKSDPDILEYPVYSTAYAVLAIEKLQSFHYLLAADGDKLSHRLQNFLIQAQLRESNGFVPTMNAYGGWGFDNPRISGEPGHMDLAHTRRALQALSAGNRRLPVLTDFQFNIAQGAITFLFVVQKHPLAKSLQPVPEGIERPQEIPFDGGFYFSPVVLQANKGRFETDGNYWRSYATATCDGILGLLAAGVPKDDERVTTAVKWLRDHTNVDYPQGIPTDHPEPWGDALLFYHYAVRAEVYDALGFPDEVKHALAEKVAALQRHDGGFVNTASPLMKEDDPLLATALAVVALSHCL